jgi:hypothetical protein
MKLATQKQEREWRELTREDGGPRVVGSLHKNREWDRDRFELATDDIVAASKEANEQQTKLSAQEDLDLRKNVGKVMEALDQAIREIESEMGHNPQVLLFALINTTGHAARNILDGEEETV